MMKKFLSCILVLAMLASMLAAFPISAGAEVTADVIIGTADELLAFSQAIKNGTTYAGKTIVLSADIDVSGKAWYGTGTFSGTFDGQGHTVSNIQCNQTDYAHTGIFGSIANGAKVQNVAIVNSTVTTNRDQNIGGLFGQQNGADSTIQNVYADIAITKTADSNVIGGFAGGVWGGSLTIENSVFAGSITSSNTQMNVGGFVGAAGCGVTIETCGFFGTMSSTKSNDRWSKFIGRIDSGNISIKNCIAGGSLTTPAWSGYIGSFVGQKLVNTNKVDVIGSLHSGVITKSTTNSNLMIGNDTAASQNPLTTADAEFMTNAALLGPSVQNLPDGWTAGAAQDAYPIPNGLIGIAPTAAEPVELYGYQPPLSVSGNTFSIRLVATLAASTEDELKNYQSVGFRVSVRCFDGDTELSKSTEQSSTTVYEKLSAANYKEHTKEELGGYIFALNCLNLPANKGTVFFTVTPFAVMADEEQTVVDGETSQFALDPGNLDSAITALTFPRYNNTGTPSAQGGENADIYTYTGVSTTQLETYQKTLAKAGYVLHGSNSIGNNRFATYVGYTDEVHLVYNPALSNRLRVVHTELGDLPNVTAPTYTAVTTPSLTQLKRAGAEDAGGDSAPGMSYVLQLADGSFLIIDGGPNNQADIDDLMQFLTDNKPAGDAKPRVSWLFTHAHSDHMGLALEFLTQKHSAISLETVYCNFPDLANMTIPKEDPTPMAELSARLFTVLDAYYPAAAQVRYHTGQKIMLPDCAIEVLFTHEDYYPNEFTWGNHTSAAFRITIEGKKFIVLGDCEEGLCDQMATVYGTDLKADILQPSHHGLNGGTETLYQKITPTWCLWPIDATRYASKVNTTAYPASQWLINYSTYDYNASETVTVWFTKNGLTTTKPTA